MLCKLNKYDRRQEDDSSNREVDSHMTSSCANCPYAIISESVFIFVVAMVIGEMTLGADLRGPWHYTQQIKDENSNIVNLCCALRFLQLIWCLNVINVQNMCLVYYAVVGLSIS